MKKFLFMALATVAFFSCSKSNDVTPDSGDTKTVTLTIKSNSTKAEEAPGTAHETAVADFTAYFLNSSDGVVETRTSATSNSGASYVFDGVSGLASKIYIVANTTLTNTTLSGSNLTDLKKSELLIKDYQQGIDKVILAAAKGVDASAITASGDAGKYSASITIAPVVARLEIAKLEAISAEDPTISDIKDFTVKAVYVNGYDKKMTLGGSVSDRTAGTTINYGTTDLKDENLTQQSVNKVIVPTAGVWAYQLFPGAVPTMVIQFSSITLENGTVLSGNLDEQCITVTGFNPNTFDAAGIYNVANIQFSSKNIGKPYEATKNVSVTLTVTPWKVNATTVVLQ